MKVLLIAGLLIMLARYANAGVLPGRAGAYVRLRQEALSAYQLRKAMKEIKAAGIDFILPEGKMTSGKLNWDSQVAPEMVENKDYMARVVRFAHAEGIKVYPVFCVCTEGIAPGGNAVLRKHPDWAVYYEGAWRGFIDPGNAEARRYELSLIRELVSKYDVDGLSLDYMRAPGRVAYTESGRAEFLAKHQVDLKEIVAIGSEAVGTEGGTEPSKEALAAVQASARKHPIWPEWGRWWTGHLNQFMGEIVQTVREVKPGLPVSTYCWGAHTYNGNYETYQDWKTWIRNGWLGWINPSGYRYTDETFRAAANLNRANVPKDLPFYITIGVLTSHGRLNSADEIKHQIAMSREAGADGVVFFTWESLRPFAAEVSDGLRAW